MLAALQEWFGVHIYLAIMVVGTLEGLGLPIPVELLFFPGVHMARHGDASFAGLVLSATFGNVFGGVAGYSLAYWGGPAVLQRVGRWVGIKPASIQKVEGFFARYGQATVFLSKFVGLIRTATIYVAGAARMSPVRYVIYLAAANLIWNSAWVFGVYRFEREALRLLKGHGPSRLLWWVLALLAALIAGRYALRWYRRHKPVNQ